MSGLSSEFTRDDIETLIESVGDWEAVGNHEYHVFNMVKSVPMPPEDHEAFEPISQIKDYFKGREKEIKQSRITRQEKAVFLKAKLMLVRRDLGINKLFDMAANSKDATESLPPKESGSTTFVPESGLETVKKQLQLAEDFIKDLGVFAHYEKFLEDRKNITSKSED